MKRSTSRGNEAGEPALAALAGGRGARRRRRRAARARRLPAGDRPGVPREAGRRAHPARREALGEPRHDPRPQRRGARGEHAGGHGLGRPAQARGSAAGLPAPREGARPRPAVAGAPRDEQPRPRVRLPRAPHAPLGRGQGKGARYPGRGHTARVPSLLSGGRSHRTPARLHQRGRRRPGRARARLRPVARRGAGRQARDARQPRAHDRGHRAHQGAAPRTGPADQHRPAGAVPRLPRAEGRRAGEQGALGLRGGDRHRHRRSPGDGQPAGLQPERPRPVRGIALSQPRDQRFPRAWLEHQAIRDCGGHGDGPLPRGHADRHVAGHDACRHQDGEGPATTSAPSM